jgi:hypothetical protein
MHQNSAQDMQATDMSMWSDMWLTPGSVILHKSALRPAAHGRAVQVDSVETCVESAYGFSA